VKKYIFDEDLEAILQDEIAKIPETWKLASMRVVSETGQRPSAAIQLSYEGQVKKAVSTGDGPVDACYKAIEKIVDPAAFLKAKQLEQEQRHAKHRDTPFALEPRKSG